MQLSFYFNRHRSLTALVSLLLLSILNIAVASPLPQSGVSEKSLTARAVEGSTITVDEYVDYLKKYYPKTDQYIQYSGYSEPQVVAFQAKNPGYYYYDDFFNADNPNSHWYDAFGADMREDDAEASGKAMSMVATEKITVFGAADWRTKGAASFYATTEADINLARLASGDLKSINHMATEDAKGLHYKAGYKEGTPNNSAPYGNDTPETNSSRNSPSSNKGNNAYGDPATQETPVGDKASPNDPASSIPKTTPTTSDPGVDPGDIHI
jgi:hypothetical protein